MHFVYFFFFSEVGLKWLNVVFFLSLFYCDLKGYNSQFLPKMPKYSKRKWSVSVCFFLLVFLRGPFDVPEKPSGCSSECFCFICCTKILCWDHPQLKRRWVSYCNWSMGKYLLCDKSSLSFLNTVFCFPVLTVWNMRHYYLGHSSKKELLIVYWARHCFHLYSFF